MAIWVLSVLFSKLMCLAQGHNIAPQVRIEPPPSRLLLSQYAIFEVLLIFMTM